MAGSLEPAFLFLGHKKELLLIDYLSILQQPRPPDSLLAGINSFFTFIFQFNRQYN